MVCRRGAQPRAQLVAASSPAAWCSRRSPPLVVHAALAHAAGARVAGRGRGRRARLRRLRRRAGLLTPRSTTRPAQGCLDCPQPPLPRWQPARPPTHAALSRCLLAGWARGRSCCRARLVRASAARARARGPGRRAPAVIYRVRRRRRRARHRAGLHQQRPDRPGAVGRPGARARRRRRGVGLGSRAQRAHALRARRPRRRPRRRRRAACATRSPGRSASRASRSSIAATTGGWLDADGRGSQVPPTAAPGPDASAVVAVVGHRRTCSRTPSSWRTSRARPAGARARAPAGRAPGPARRAARLPGAHRRGGRRASAGAWSATCTTAPSSASSRWRWTCASRAAGSCASPRASTRELGAAEDDLRLAVAELRDVAHGLHPHTLQESGLAAALLALAEDDPRLAHRRPARRARRPRPPSSPPTRSSPRRCAARPRRGRRSAPSAGADARRRGPGRRAPASLVVPRGPHRRARRSAVVTATTTRILRAELPCGS